MTSAKKKFVISKIKLTFKLLTLNLPSNTIMYVHPFVRTYVRTSCLVRMSILVGSESRVLGQRRALPFLGVTAIPRSGKFVSPPGRTYGYRGDIVRVEYTVLVKSEITIETLEPEW